MWYVFILNANLAGGGRRGLFLLTFSQILKDLQKPNTQLAISRKWALDAVEIPSRPMFGM
jgi:hypothetical protein